MLTSLPPPPQVEGDDPSGAGGTEEEVFEAEVDQVWQLARLISVSFYFYNQRSLLYKSLSLVVSVTGFWT